MPKPHGGFSAGTISDKPPSSRSDELGLNYVLQQRELDFCFRQVSYSDPKFCKQSLPRLSETVGSLLVFEMSWASEGSYVACEIGGVPVVVWECRRSDSSLPQRVRSSSRSLMPCGVGCASQLRCINHGWEYGPDGRLAKLPDGQSFHGFKAKGIQLESFPVEILGECVL